MAELRSILQTPLIRQAGPLWKEATESPFLEAVGSGKISPDAFARWLVQDYWFAQGLLEFQAVTLSKVPRRAHKPLIGGLVALDSELEWFEAHAGRLQLDLEIEPHPVCRRYTDYFLRAAYTEPPPVLLAILFGVEVSYLAAWSALEPVGPYAEFIKRWSTPQFTEYVDSLRALTEEFPGADQQKHFNYVLELERDFWRMSWEG